MLCTQKVWERGLKKWILLQSQSQQHDSHSSDGDAGIENRVTDKGGEQEGEGEMNGESSMDECTPTFVNRQPVGICCMTQGTQTMENSVEIP